MFRKAFGVLVLVGPWVLLCNACGSSNVSANDCSVKCDDAHNTCVKQCTEDVCTTKCETDLDDCKASCEKVKTTSGGTNG